MTAPRLRKAQTDELGREQLARLAAICEQALGRPFSDGWERVGAGLHVIGEVAGRGVSHAMIVDRSAYVGHEADQAIDVGYVEHVATLPAHEGQGVGVAVMTEIGRIIGDEYTIGAISTQQQTALERLGWERWAGPTLVRTADGELVRTPERDGSVMVLRTERTPPGLDGTGPIAIDWRPANPW